MADLITEIAIYLVYFSILGVGTLGLLALMAWLSTKALDRIRNAGYALSHVIEYWYYREPFKEWLKENRGKNLSDFK